MKKIAIVVAVIIGYGMLQEIGRSGSESSTIFGKVRSSLRRAQHQRDQAEAIRRRESGRRNPIGRNLRPY